jgi:1,4-alpha-glucan branching enzyme
MSLAPTDAMAAKRHRPLGAEPSSDGVSFRLWAPKARTVDLVLDGEEVALTREESGHFHGVAASARAGSRYRLRIDGAEDPLPDPASRFQPEGPHGPSMVIDPNAYVWRDRAWHGVQLKGAVIYEMHIGTFTRDGTWRAAIGQLARLKELGITLLEVLPIAEFPGRFGWGYDGVDLWAPSHLYGTPDDFRAFVDAAHGCGLGVILDVVYHHFGPDGCYLRRFSDSYFTAKHVNDWGDSINFDGEGSDGVREFFSQNAAYWIEEFHLDGLRLDATQSGTG